MAAVISVQELTTLTDRIKKCQQCHGSLSVNTLTYCIPKHTTIHMCVLVRVDCVLFETDCRTFLLSTFF